MITQQEREVSIIPYVKTRDTVSVSLDEFFTNPETGANCQLLAVAFTKARGYEIDERYRSSEVAADLTFTDAILDPNDMQTGDIVGLTRLDNNDPKKIHLGVAYKDPERGMYIVHNAEKIGEATISPLRLLLKQDRYKKIACIKRPKIKLENNPYERELEELGFEYLL